MWLVVSTTFNRYLHNQGKHYTSTLLSFRVRYIILSKTEDPVLVQTTEITFLITAHSACRPTVKSVNTYTSVNVSALPLGTVLSCTQNTDSVQQYKLIRHFSKLHRNGSDQGFLHLRIFLPAMSISQPL